MLSGLLAVNKPIQKTSHDIVAAARKCLKQKKIGHFGTLDPFAEGVLILALGKATKFFDFYLSKRKSYSGIVKFGYATTTYDREGDVDSERTTPDLYSINLKEIISGFIGKQSQLPPMYSAKKVNGKPLYKYAREKKDISRKPAEVEIYSFEYDILDPTELRFTVEVSSGTYIRSIAHDLGVKTGYGAFLESLKRESVGEIDLADTIPFDLLTEDNRDAVVDRIIAFDRLLPEFSAISVNGLQAEKVLNGMPVTADQVSDKRIGHSGELFKIMSSDNRILAISRKDKINGTYRPYMVFKD